MNVHNDIHRLFNVWLDRTHGLLIQQLVKQKIGVTHDLRKKLKRELRSKGMGYLEGEISMLTRGRFIDMGVGRGHSLSGSTRGSFNISSGRKGRKSKPWYSKTLWGRLYDLYGAIGYQVAESSMQIVKSSAKA